MLEKLEWSDFMYSYTPNGVCSKKMEFDIVENKINKVIFTGGCDGNLQGLAALLQGMEVSEAIKRLKGLRCGQKNTSCPDQFATALEALVK